MSATPPQNAKHAITSLCRVLKLHGIGHVSPEIVRQAKFDGPVVRTA